MESGCFVGGDRLRPGTWRVQVSSGLGTAGELFTEVAEFGAEFGMAGWIDGRWGGLLCCVGGAGLWRQAETDATDVEIFLEVVELEKIGEFKCSDIAALMADFLLQIGNDATEVVGSEARAEELVPESLAIEAQAEFLTGVFAVKVVDPGHFLRPVLRFRRALHEAGDD